MKLTTFVHTFLLSLLLLPSTIGFAIVPPANTNRRSETITQSDTSLNAVSVGPRPTRRVLGDSTVPVATHKVNKLGRQMMKDVIIPPDFTLSWAVASLAPLIWLVHPMLFATDGTPSFVSLLGGGFHLLFAAVLYVQTARVRCVFEKNGFEFYNVVGKGLDLDNGAKLEKKPSNFVLDERGNQFNYDQIINYDFFPSEEFPVICYVKETQTPKEFWDRSIAAFDSYGRGQPHFFPGIFNVHKFKEQLELRGVKRKLIPTLKNQN